MLTYVPDESLNGDLTKKYFVKYATNNEDPDNIIRTIILNGFESWNKGISSYTSWVDSNFDTSAKSKNGNNERDMTQY